MDKNPLLCGESHGISTVTSFYLVALRETNVRSLNWRSVWWRWVAFQLHKTCTNVFPELFAHVESPPYRRSFSNLTLHQSACSESAEGECNLAQANVWDVDRGGRASTLTFANIEVCFVLYGLVHTNHRPAFIAGIATEKMPRFGAKHGMLGWCAPTSLSCGSHAMTPVWKCVVYGLARLAPVRISFASVVRPMQFFYRRAGIVTSSKSFCFPTLPFVRPTPTAVDVYTCDWSHCCDFQKLFIEG